MDTRRHVRLALVALVCTGVAVVVSWLLAPPVFGINDDTKIQLILSGGGWTEPSAHAQFINIVLGWVLSSLFRLVPSVPWWFTWQVMGVVVSLYAWNLSLAYALCGSEGPLVPRKLLAAIALCALSSVSAFMYALSLVSFTLTAGTMAASAVLLQCVRLAQPGLGQRRRYGVLVAALVVSAFCTRPSSAIAALSFGVLLFVPLLADVAKGSGDRRARMLALARALVPLAVGVALAFCCNVANTVKNSAPQWQQFLSTNAARHKYLDYPHESFDENPALYASVGWSEELEALVNDEWLFMDDRVTPEAFTALSKGGTLTEQLGIRHIIDSWRHGEGMFDSRTVTGLVVLIAAAVVALLAVSRDKTRWAMALLAVVACAGELYYLEMRGRLVTRVALVSLWPMFAFSLGQLVTHGHDCACELARRDRADGWRGRMVLRAVGAALLVLGAARIALAAYRTDSMWKLAYSLLLVAFAVLLVLFGLRRRTWLRGLVVGLMCPLLVAGCFLTKRDVRGTQVTIDLYEEAADAGIEYVDQHPEYTFFCMVSLFSPFDPQITALPANMYYVGGWEYYLPQNIARMERLRGMDTHYYDILLRDDVRVLCLTDEQAEQLRACIEQVTDADVVWERAGHPGYGVLCKYSLAS